MVITHNKLEKYKMKILFISDFKYPDYQNDIVYHGLIDLNCEIYETSNPSYMLKSYQNPHLLYGKGFSIYSKLNHSPNVEPDYIIKEKIISKFYDQIIFGSVHRSLQYFELVKEYYNKDSIHFIDGEDHTVVNESILNFGTYWKRECLDSRCKSISFGIPESQLLLNSKNKNKLLATVIPGNLSTYIFDNEDEYYSDYASSYYGVTCKKAGWDCLRHYEILANRCIPYFLNLEECPSLILSTFPKSLILETNKYASKNKIHPEYDYINEILFTYTKENLTTKKIAKLIIN